MTKMTICGMYPTDAAAHAAALTYFDDEAEGLDDPQGAAAEPQYPAAATVDSVEEARHGLA